MAKLILKIGTDVDNNGAVVGHGGFDNGSVDGVVKR
jgi:hypothetical protein